MNHFIKEDGKKNPAPDFLCINNERMKKQKSTRNKNPIVKEKEWHNNNSTHKHTKIGEKQLLLVD